MRKIILSLFLFTVSFALQAQNVNQVLNVQEFINLAKQNDPNFQKISHDKKQLDFFLDKNSPYQPTIFNYEHEYGVDAQNDLEITNYSTSIAKKFVDTGTNLSLGYSGGDSSYREERVIEISIEQSLYKNLFGQSDRLKKSAIETEKQVINLQILESYEDYLSYIITQYLDFHKLYLDQQLAEKIYQEALNLQKNVFEKKQKNIATQIDMDRADLQILLRKEDVIKKRKDFISKWIIIKEITGSDKLIVPTIDLTELLNKSVEAASITNLRVYQIVDLQENIAKKELKLSEYDNRPSLQLVTGYRMDDSQRYSTLIHSNELLAGIKFQMPFGNRVGKANESSASFDLITVKLTKQSLVSALKGNLADLESQLKDLREKYKLSHNKVMIMSRILKDEEGKYQYGKIDLDKLIESKSNFAAYRFENQTDLLNINTKTIELLALTDGLLGLETQ